MSGLRSNVADLLHHPAARRAVRIETDASDLGGVGGARLDGSPLTVDVVLERVPDGIVVQGRVDAVYQAQCSRCLRPLTRTVSSRVRELFESDPIDGETYPIAGEEVDLELPVRDTLLLDLPVAPLCRDDCAGLCGTCGADLNLTTCDCDPNPPDPRWDALRALDLDR